MKNIVLNDHYHETDLKPNDLLQDYVAKLNEDIQQFFPEDQLVSTDCPGCHSKQHAHAFTKHGLNYHVCSDCHSLFIHKRP